MTRFLSKTLSASAITIEGIKMTALPLSETGVCLNFPTVSDGETTTEVFGVNIFRGVRKG